AKEKELTRTRDALAAERRRMPWMAVEKEYKFDGPKGTASLLDLFDGRQQMIDATAPDHVKKAPAYAHSLSRGNPGAMIAAPPPTCHKPEIQLKYSGYPRWLSWTRIHSICPRFHTDPATNSEITTKVAVQ